MKKQNGNNTVEALIHHFTGSVLACHTRPSLVGRDCDRIITTLCGLVWSGGLSQHPPAPHLALHNTSRPSAEHSAPI